MTRELRFILPSVWAAGAVTVWLAVQAFATRTPAAPQFPVWFSILLVLAILSEMKPVPYTLGRASKDESLTITLILVTIFAYDWPAAVLMAVAAVVVADIAVSKPYYKILFNGSMYAIATLAAGVTYHAGLQYVQMAAVTLPAIWGQVLARFLSGVVYYIMNVTLLMLVLSRVQRLGVGQMVVWGVRDSVFVNIALITIAIAMSILWELHPAAALVLAPPVFMAKSGYQGYSRLRLEAEEMLATLADILDLRDHNTGRHSLRVSELCYGVARLLGVPEDRALAIQAIARVHDVGKIAIRDAVLQKPGPLSPHERSEAQAHVEVGGRILHHLSVYRPHLPVLLQHHEWHDGRGYPAGLRGESIDIGARILSVCDAYDTLISDRPYHAAIPIEAAMDELYRHAGSQFDPKVVEALERLLVQEGRLKAAWRAMLPAGPSTTANDVALEGGEPAVPIVVRDAARMTQSH